jgi:hypothetical protein
MACSSAHLVFSHALVFARLSLVSAISALLVQMMLLADVRTVHLLRISV